MRQGRKHKTLKGGALAALLAALILCGADARAQTCTGPGSCGRQSEEHADLQQTERDQHQETRQYIDDQFIDQQDWMRHIFYEYILPSLMEMANDMTSVAMHQMVIVGKFFDAKQQIETQRVLQEMQARAHKDYQPSLGVCTFGTLPRSLAASETYTDLSRSVFGEWALNRLSGNTNVSGSEGQDLDRRDRLNQFRKSYCQTSDHNNNLDAICSSSASQWTVNKDIDYANVVEFSPTLNYDFTKTALSQDAADIMALASNLYGHELPLRIPETFLNEDANHPKVANIRALIAKRSVAQASFFSIVGLRSMGSEKTSDDKGSSEDTQGYMRTLMKSLDYELPDINLMMCGKPDVAGGGSYMKDDATKCRPSYFAQMEVLTKRLYQDPNFYTDTYDKPANVARKKVAMQAIGLMQDFDTLESYLRTEMMLSVVLETEVIKLQETVQNSIGSLRTEGER